jgi:DNA repair protein RadC
MAQSNQEFTQMYVPEFKLTQVADINLEKLTNITSSSSAVQVLSQFIAQKGLTEQINVNEFVFILYLNKRNKVIAVTNLAIGGIDMTVMDVRLVFGLGLKCGASAIIVAHNHPTGNLQPSEADRQIGRRIKEVGVLLQINALDFLIITSNNGYYSFADNSEYAHGGIMAKGGNLFGDMEGVDLFEDYEDQPQEVQRILSKYEIEDNNYDVLQNLKAELEAIGYTMDFGLDAEPYDLRKIGQVGKSEFMAKGGITEHGLRVGDTIVSEIDANTIVVDNAVSGRRTINISTGQSMAKGGMSDKIVILVKDKKGNVVLKTTSTNKAADYCGLHGRENFTVETLDGRRIMAKGGRMGFKALSEKVASHYAGKSVPAKYQPEYGKFYDADEADTVGNKVAAKVYRLQQGK